jgi:hypothetical protein
LGSVKRVVPGHLAAVKAPTSSFVNDGRDFSANPSVLGSAYVLRSGVSELNTCRIGYASDQRVLPVGQGHSTGEETSVGYRSLSRGAETP